MEFAVVTLWVDRTSSCFAEVSEVLVRGLTSLGHDVLALEPNEFASDRCNIVLGSNLLPYLGDRNPPVGSVLYNLEQVSSLWLRPDIMRPYRVWDYATSSMEFLRSRGVNARLVPLGYVPELTRIAPARMQDIDVLFFGALNERRRRILDQLRRRGLHVIHLSNCYGRARDDVIARSKVVLNIHYYTPGTFEVVRVLYLLANRACVVSEVAGDAEPFREGVEFAAYEDLASRCIELVRDPERRAALAERGFAGACGRPAAMFLGPAVQELECERNLGAVRVESHATTPRRVSLCMIVKNEAANLEACLASAEGLAQEIVVVDTGSSDGTQEIARARGARVHTFAWSDDFAAARNESLRHATGDWILWLDADDRIPPRGRERLRDLLARLPDENVAYLMTVLCPGPDGGPMSQVAHARLFRNDPRIRWTHRVHEQIVQSIERSGARLEPTDIAIVHIGYTKRGAMDAKLQRNLRLIDLELESRPLDPGLLQARAVTLLGLGRSAEALVALNICEPATSLDEFARNIFALRGDAYAAEGGLNDALAAVRTGLDRFPRDTRLCFLEAQLLAAMGQLVAAEASLRGQLIVGEEHGRFACADRTLAAFRARHLLAEVLLERGAPEEAEGEARAVVKARPSFGQGWLTLGETLLVLGKTRELESLCAALGDSVDAEVARTVLKARQHVLADAPALGLSLVREALRANPEHLVLLKAKVRLLFEQGDRSHELRAALRSILEHDALCVRTSAIERALTMVTLGGLRPAGSWAARARTALGPLVALE